MLFINKFKGYLVAYYHLISDKKTPYYKGKKVSLETFKKHIKYFKKTKEFVSFHEISKLKKSGKNLSKYIVLTFDDGYRLNLESISDFLQDEKIKATFFLSGCVFEKKLMWRDHISFGYNFLLKSSQANANDFLNSFEKSLNWKYPDFINKYLSICEEFGIPSQESILNEWKPYLSISSLETLIANGHDIGLHSQNHPYFKNLTTEEAISEVVQNNELVKSFFNIEPIVFSFPFGARHDDPLFYKKVMKKTKIEFFCGINASLFSNRLGDSKLFTERLGMEDHRPLFFSTKIRPLFRGIKSLWK